MPTDLTPATGRRSDTTPAPAVPAPGTCASNPRLGGVRRRDGLLLATTGTIPDRIRAAVLAEHRADLRARARAGLRARVEAGELPMPIPYGYRRIRTQPNPQPATPTVESYLGYADLGPDYTDTPYRGTADPHTTPALTVPSPAEQRWTDPGRTGRAPALHWRADDDCADTIAWIRRCLTYGQTPAQVAARLNTDDAVPPQLTITGRPVRWTGRAVRELLCDPILTGHSVWGRTHHGRPRPREEWIVSTTLTHPPILDADTHARIVDLLTTHATTGDLNGGAGPRSACSVSARWRR